MTPELQALLIAAMSTLGGGFMGWLSYRMNMRKTRADTAAIIEETSGKLVQRMEKKLNDLEIELNTTKKELQEKLKEIEGLAKRVRTLEEIIIIKDGKIAELIKEGLEKDAKISALEHRVDELENELLKFRLK